MYNVIKLYESNEYTYPHEEFIPNVCCYLHKDEKIRPAILIIPGGGYATVSPTESEIVAKTFLDMGYQTFVLTYTTNLLKEYPLGWQPVLDVAKAVLWIKRHQLELCVDSGKLALVGFSAGGHLCGTYGNHYHRSEFATLLHGDESLDILMPAALLLCYPVVTTHPPYVNKGSIQRLVGNIPSKELLRVFSVEKNVTSKTPPIFLWHTITDQLVPYQNSIALAEACAEADVKCELHLFPTGPHGLSVNTEQWADGDFGDGTYTLAQVLDTFRLLQRNSPERFPREMQLSSEMSLKNFLLNNGHLLGAHEDKKVFPSVGQWPELADRFLQAIYQGKL